MTLRSRLAASYARFAKRPLRRPPYADELLWLPAWLVAVPLARLGTPPEAVVVAGFACGLGAVAIIAGGGLPEHGPLCAALILANAVLDSVDGGVARMTGQIRLIGGLLDLVFDFFFTLLIFVAIVLAVGPGGAGGFAIPLAIAAFLANVFAATVISFVMFRDEGGGQGLPAAEQARRFADAPAADASITARNRPLFRLLVGGFNLGWGAVFRLILRAGLFRERLGGGAPVRHILALGAVGSQLAVLALVIAIGWPLTTFLAYECALGGMALGLLLAFER
ncbi:MAG: CDP-alcohol phosphatidyltransferase family protein [Ardenticatenia bacterium]|nr:CDP-alcohol phosphatidyltransferase family protein [Ardenticatenia bacterium]